MRFEKLVPHVGDISRRRLGCRNNRAGSLFLIELLHCDIDSLKICFPVYDDGHGKNMNPVSDSSSGMIPQLLSAMIAVRGIVSPPETSFILF